MDTEEFLVRYKLGQRDFRNHILSSAKLQKANLRKVIFGNLELNEAKLHGTDLSKARIVDSSMVRADLSDAKLCEAYIYGTNISHAFLKRADLREAELFHSDLIGAWLECADLRGANLTNSNLTGAYLKDANLAGVDLSSTILDGATLKGANLDGTKLPKGSISPDYGEFTPEPIVTRPHIAASSERRSDYGEFTPEPIITNQGIQFNSTSHLHEWENLRFRSKSEIKIAEALDRAGVIFWANCLARLNNPKKPSGRGNKEADFLVCYKGYFGILEVDGPSHTAVRRVEEQERERLFRHHGIRVIEHFSSNVCYTKPDEVVREFLQLMEKMYFPAGS